MIVPTRRFWFWVAAGIPLALGGAWVPGMEQLVVLYDVLLVLLLVLSRVMVGQPNLLLVTRTMDLVLSVRTRNTIHLLIENHGKVAMRGRIRDEAPDLMRAEGNEFFFDVEPGRASEHHYELVPTRRGSTEFPGTYVRLQAPLGLCEIQFQVNNASQIDVYPNVKAVQEFDLLNRRGRLGMIGIRRARLRGIGTEFESLRDYQPDDDYRRIDWNASAKLNRPIVREYEVERNQAVFIVIDAGRHMLADVGDASKLDHVLDVSLLLMHAALRAGDQIGLLVFADRVLTYIPPRRGKSQVGLILDAIHDLQARPLESDSFGALAYLASRWKRRALMVLFSDVDHAEAAERLVQSIQPLQHRHLWFLARVKDPELDELALRPITDEREFFERASLSWYLGERLAARGVLSRLRLENLEAEPADLGAALVNAYVDAKQRAAI